MTGMDFGLVLFDMTKRMQTQLDGAVTTGIVPGSDGRTTPAALPSSSDDRDSCGSLLARAWRLPARFATRPEAAPRGTC